MLSETIWIPGVKYIMSSKTTSVSSTITFSPFLINVTLGLVTNFNLLIASFDFVS